MFSSHQDLNKNKVTLEENDVDIMRWTAHDVWATELGRPSCGTLVKPQPQEVL